MANPFMPKKKSQNPFIPGGEPVSGEPNTQIRNYQERLRLTGQPDEVAARAADDRNFLERALNMPRNTGLLGDIGDLLSRTTYASANIAKEITDTKKSTPVDVIRAGWRGLTGQDRTSYTDVLAQAGMKPGPVRSILGGAMDIALDPTTYLTLGTSAAGKTSLKLAGKAIPGTAEALTALKTVGKPIREAVASTKVGQAVGKAVKGYRFRPAGVAEEEFKPWVERVEQFQKEYRAKPQEAMRQAIEEGKQFTPEEQVLAGKLREQPQAKIAASKEVRQYAQKWANINKGLVQEAKKVGLKINELEDYLAHIPGQDFEALSKKAGTQTIGGKTGPLRAYDPNARARTLEGTVEEINKRMGGEFFEPRMPVADTVRNARLERAIATQKFLNDVAANPKWAMPIKKGQSPPPGWKIWEPEGPFRFYPSKEGGIGVTRKVPRYAVPEHVAEYLEEAMRTFKDDTASKQIRNLWRQAQGLWVSTVTTMNPGYYSRNLQGNIFNAWLAGLKTIRPYLDAFGIQTGRVGRIANGMDYQQVLDLFRQQALDNSNFFSTSGADIVKQARQELAGGKRKGLLQRGKDLNSSLETNSKLALFIDQLNKGASPEEAARTVKKYLFDYQDLTPFERKLKDFVPFYTWSRKNIPLQFESMITQPGKYAAIAKAKHAIEDMTTEEVPEDQLPDWFQEEYAIRTPFKDASGNRIYWIPNLPFVDVATLDPRDIYSRLSPAIKMLPDLLTSENISLGIPIERYEGQTVETPFGWRIPAKLDYVLKQFGVVRNVGNVASSLQGTEGARTLGTIMASLAGFSNYPLNAQKAQQNREYELLRQYRDYFNRLEETGNRPPTITELKKGANNPFLPKKK